MRRARHGGGSGGAELDELIEDTLRFSRQEARTAQTAGRQDEARTAIALELAAARLLAHIATPMMPRFSGRLATALGLPEPTDWPHTAELVAPGSEIRLADTVFFKPTPETDGRSQTDAP